jgi:hypothetical protein
MTSRSASNGLRNLTEIISCFDKYGNSASGLCAERKVSSHVAPALSTDHFDSKKYLVNPRGGEFF